MPTTRKPAPRTDEGEGVRTTLYLPRSLHRWLRQTALDRRTTASALVREALYALMQAPRRT